MRQVNHGDVDVAPVGAMVFPGLQRDAVLILKIHVKPWHNAQHRHPGQRLDLLYPERRSATSPRNLLMITPFTRARS